MEENKDFPNIWHAILILFFLVGVQIVIAVILHDLGINLVTGDPGYGAIITVLSCGIIFSILMSYKNITYKQLFSPSINLPKPFLIMILIGVLITSAGGMVLLSDIDTFIISQFSISDSDIAMFDRLLGGGLISAITVCIVAPFVEEMLFRGIFLRSFLCNYSTFTSITFSSLLFAILHFNIYQMVSAYIVGTFLGWLYVVTKSLWPSIFAHALLNILSMIFYYFSGGFQASLSLDYHHPLTLIMSIISVVFGIKIIQITSNLLKQENKAF